MNLKHLSMTALAAVFLFSCSNDKENIPTVPEEETKVPVTINVDFGDVYSRAVTFPGNTATDNEKRLTNVAVFIFNNQKLLEAYDNADEVRNGGFANSSHSFEFEVSVGRHYIFAVANVPRTYLSYATEGISIDDFSEEILKYDLDVLTGVDFFSETDGSDDQLAQESRGFFMTSKDGFMEIWAIDTDDVLDASINQFDLELVRAVSKVSVAFDPETQQDGQLTEVKYLVDNNPTSFYVVERYNGSALITPFYSENWVDPNNFQAPLDDYQSAILPGMSDTERTWTYCMENSNFIPKEGNATVAMIQGVFIPSQLLDASGTTSTANTTKGTFWRIATLKDGKRYYDPGYYATKPVDSVVGTDQEAVEFVDGVCYYPVWLRNPNSGNENQYTVKRNSYYKITINSVAGAGVPDPDEAIDPEIPLDNQVSIGVTISVTNWTEISDEQGI